MALNTVCKEAGCPNIYECYGSKTATFLILGSVCTRNCGFCLVEKGKPDALDTGEPNRVADAVSKLGLKYAVITSVTRDDLEDGGASVFAATISQIRKKVPDCKVEVLIPDFKGNRKHLDLVLDEEPDVLNHNIETVERLYKLMRKSFDYERSLNIIRYSKAKMTDGRMTKSGLVIGMGESWNEIIETINDLKDNGCDIITIGQYLAPSRKHHPVAKFYTPEEFEALKEISFKTGFKHVMSGPLVRSSYHAAKMF